MTTDISIAPRRYPQPLALVELIKPVTWFPPVWAFLCGAVSAGQPLGPSWALVLAGMVLAGPVVCGMSQAANDWCDREVDAINEPHRPIPSGRVPGIWGLIVAVAMTVLALIYAQQLSPLVLWATVFGVAAAWAYSAPPIRLKRSGWWGPALVALSYEGLPWFTGAALLGGALPGFKILAIAGLYAFGAHGIMTLNDFKALEGDRVTGIRSLPVVLGPEVAARLACTVMGLAQALVVALLIIWDAPVHAALVTLLLMGQVWAMRRLLQDPKARAPWYNATGVLMYVSGMMIAAFALRGMA